jgi:hypothetical protein
MRGYASAIASMIFWRLVVLVLIVFAIGAGVGWLVS